MDTLTHFDFLRALGSSLINSIWQFGIFWLVFRFFLVPLKNVSAAVKHGVLIVFLSLSAGWFLLDILQGYNFLKDVIIYSAQDLDKPDGLLSYWNKALIFFEQNLPILSLVYLGVVMILFLNFSRYFFYARTVRTRELQKIGLDLRLQVNRLAQRLGIKKKVDIWLSALIDTPMIIGFLKPTILMPLASVNQLSVLQLEAILLHELAHIRRNDYLINIYISTLRILFFFNPFCRMLIESVRQEREKSCDDWVLQFRFDPHQYASALFHLETVRSGAFSLGIAAGGTGKKFLLERIERILNVKSKRRQQGRFNLAGYISALFIMGLILAFAPARFEVEKLEKINSINLPLVRTASVDKKYFVPANDQAARTDEEIPDVQLLPGNPDEPANDEPFADPGTEDSEAFGANVSATSSEQPGLIHVNNVTFTEERAFAAPTPTAPAKPVVDEERPAPFVPNSSFSFQVVEDTTHPKVKEETYTERAARESLVKAKKALTQINLEKLQKEILKKGKVSTNFLLRQLELSLEALDWEEINRNVADSIDKQSVEKWKSSLKNEIEGANRYKQLQQQYQLLKTQIQDAQINLKREVELQKIEVVREIKKTKTIVHL